MTTQPAVQQGGEPVKKSIWRYFCTRANAAVIFAKVQSISPNAKIVDGNDTFFGGSLVYENEDVRAWNVQGTVKKGDTEFMIDESLAHLFDRQTKPDPFVDKNPDTTLGGTNLKANDIGGGYLELSWSKS